MRLYIFTPVDTPMTSTERGGDCGTVPGHSPTRQLPSPRIDESRGSKVSVTILSQSNRVGDQVLVGSKAVASSKYNCSNSIE